MLAWIVTKTDPLVTPKSKCLGFPAIQIRGCVEYVNQSADSDAIKLGRPLHFLPVKVEICQRSDWPGVIHNRCAKKKSCQ